MMEDASSESLFICSSNTLALRMLDLKFSGGMGLAEEAAVLLRGSEPCPAELLLRAAAGPGTEMLAMLASLCRLLLELRPSREKPEADEAPPSLAFEEQLLSRPLSLLESASASVCVPLDPTSGAVPPKTCVLPIPVDACCC